MNKEKPDYIFNCRKCGHHLFVPKDKVVKVLKTDCEACGEEANGNWILAGEGNYDKEFGT